MSINLKRLEAISAIAFAVIFGIGTWAQFALPYPRHGPWPQGCYLGDALIVFVRCDSSVPGFVEPVLTWAWYLTWGWFWPAAFFVPLMPLLGIPLAIIWIATVVLAIRWAWRGVTRLRRQMP